MHDLHSLHHLIVAMVACVALVAITVLVHYEGLRLISDRLIPRLRLHPRHEMVYVIFGVFLAHTVEVWIFAGAYVVLVDIGIGRLASGVGGTLEGNFLDYLYFSSVSYTSLGLGDVYPTGSLRLVTGLEALCGLLMTGWSASYTYLIMEKRWERHRTEHPERHARH